MEKKSAWKVRYNLVIVLFLVGLILMFDRALISTALPVMQTDLNLSPVSLGLVMGSFSIAYALMQIPGGLLADKFGSRLIGAISILFWSVFTFFTGLVSSFATLVGVRFLFGLGEGSFVPAQYKALAVWFPKKERGRANAMVNISMMIGGAFTAIIAAALIGNFGWRTVFHVMFIPGVLLAALFWFVVRNSPANNKRVSAQELAEINADDVAVESAQKVRAVELLKFPVVWQLYVVYFVSAMVNFGVVNWMSIYVVDHLKGTLMQFGIAALIVSIGGMIGQIIGGVIADKSRATQKYQMCFSWLIASVFLYLGVSTDSINTAIMFFAVESFFFFLAVSAFYARMSTALPRSAMGLGSGIIQTSGYIAGAISPVVIGAIVQATSGSYKIAFVSMCVLLVLAGLLALVIKKDSLDDKQQSAQVTDPPSA